MQHQQYAEEQGLLGSLCPGQKKLEGKTFYLDNVKKRPTALLLETVSLLGGRVESFLHKDVSFVVTGSPEDLKGQNCTDTKAGTKLMSEEAQRPVMQRECVLNSDKQRPRTPRPMPCGSRGKALLEKAIRNNERLQGSGVLANARSWGVKILNVDDVILYLKQLTRESFSGIHKRPERSGTKLSSHVVKAAALRSPYLKVEDMSRRYKPLHIQSMTFPALWYSGRFSPFESPPPPRFEKQTEEKKHVENSIQDKSQTPLWCHPSPWRPRKKDLSYCECCHQPFTNLEEHLQSDQHRAFVLDPSNYSVMDQLVAEMIPGFNPNPAQLSEETLNRPPTPLPVCELEPLTDAETEHTVQALQRQGSSFNNISSPIGGPLSSSPARPSPRVQFTVPNPPATPPADILPFTTNTDCQLPDSQPHALSPAMPVSDVEPQAHNSASQKPDTQHLSPCPDTPCLSSDPYSLPPVLSPQVPYAFHIVEPACPYLDPPVLSPQLYTAEEVVEAQPCEMDTAESASLSFFNHISTGLFPSVALTNTATGSNQESLVGLSGITCSTKNGLDCATLLSHRSRSLPPQSATAPNPKKHCRSASPEHSQSKRRRITVKCGYSSSWTEQGHLSVKPESDILAKPDGSLLFDKVSSTCALEKLGSKQTFSSFCVPTVQNFTWAPNQVDILGHGSTFVADHPSQPFSSKVNICDPPLQFPKDKPHSAFFSQGSQCSLSHSTSVCIESALIPDLAALCPSSSDSDWDCGLLSQLGPNSAPPLLTTEQSCELDKELLHVPCTWMNDTSYESRLHTVLQPSKPATSLCGEEMDPSAFSRTVVQIVEVQH
ncbi:uncharacterized protein dbf4b isoform X2 [Etheostoma cragini]|uniref:uncharacterized protein dbf4b isoform X2 n=1 Tax=Etheostoma cragini TaxID=417921 RepID=UPI00155E4C16|nr:uncharacterized protein dbf4b isoform X2 [Etheostoma cragini]